MKHAGNACYGDAIAMEQKQQNQQAQFAHIDTYARKPKPGAEGAKWSAQDVLAEAVRTPGHCGHVAAPRPPEVIAGLHPGRLAERLDELVEQRRVAGRRRPRGDVHVLACAVYSWPEHTDYADTARMRAWIADTVAWHTQHVGPVDSAVLHLDEAFPHIHVYTVSADARGLTPGWQAKRAVAEAGASAQQQNQAYRSAMSDWQDRYYAGVGAYHGLERLGPARQRLRRSEWRAAKTERLRAADARRDARDAALAAEQAAEQARERASRAQMREQLVGARVSQLVVESKEAEARLAELTVKADRLSADLAALPVLRGADDRATVLDAALQWIEHLGERPEVRRVWDAVAAIRAGGPEAVEQARQVIVQLRAELVAQQRAAEAELDDYRDGPGI